MNNLAGVVRPANSRFHKNPLASLPWRRRRWAVGRGIGKGWASLAAVGGVRWLVLVSPSPSTPSPAYGPARRALTPAVGAGVISKTSRRWGRLVSHILARYAHSSHTTVRRRLTLYAAQDGG